MNNWIHDWRVAAAFVFFLLPFPIIGFLGLDKWFARVIRAIFTPNVLLAILCFFILLALLAQIIGPEGILYLIGLINN